MGEKYVVTVRFHMEGVEAELYGRLTEGKREAGLSMPDYIKRILKEYFEKMDRKDEWGEWSGQLCKEVAEAVERAVRKCVRGCSVNVNAMGTGIAPMADAETADNHEEAGLPAQSEEIPEGALDFLDGME